MSFKFGNLLAASGATARTVGVSTRGASLLVKGLRVYVALLAVLCGSAHAITMANGLSVSLTTIDFGDVIVNGHSPVAHILMTNTTSAPIGPLTISTAGLPTPWDGSSGCGLVTIAPGGSCNVAYSFNPLSVGKAAIIDPLNVNGVVIPIVLVGNGVAVVPPDIASTIPLLSMPPFCGLNPGLSVSNLGAGDGPAFAADMVKMLASALAQPLTYVEQNACGSVVLGGYNGGKLALMPLGFNTTDARPNGIYPVGNGQYTVVRKNQSLAIAPALVHIEQLTGMLLGAGAKQLDGGAMSATVNGLTYVVQAGVGVQSGKPGASALLAQGSDGYYHFTDTLGNNQALYPAFADPVALRSLLQGIDNAATLNVQLNGTATTVLNGKPYTLVPDITLTKTPANRVGQNWWQESATRFWVVAQPSGTVQGITLKP